MAGAWLFGCAADRAGGEAGPRHAGDQINVGNLQPRRFAGYAAIFDHPDRGGDIVRKGAFGRAAKAGLPLLWQHDRARRIGFIERLEEDDRGLRVVATMDADAPPVADGAGLSFGYRVRDARTVKKANGTYRELIDLDLIEVSIVNHPMQPLARVLKTSPLPQAGGGFIQGETDGL
jgi:HK97 family phage prohead protease